MDRDFVLVQYIYSFFQRFTLTAECCWYLWFRDLTVLGGTPDLLF